MKNSIFIFTLLAAMSLLSCETEPIIFNGPDHVRFSESGLTKKESYNKAIRIEVHVVGNAPASDVTVNYSVSGTARAGVDYTITNTNNSVTIKKGEYFGYIEVHLIDNANNILRSQNLVLTLQSVSSSDVEVGQGPSAIGKIYTLTIEDDCILSGQYAGTQNAFDVPIEGISISSTDCENYLLSNWNINIFSPPYDYALTFVDNGDNTLTIPEQETDTKLKGKGIVDPVTRKITLTITLMDFDNEEITINLSPN